MCFWNNFRNLFLQVVSHQKHSVSLATFIEFGILGNQNSLHSLVEIMWWIVSTDVLGDYLVTYGHVFVVNFRSLHQTYEMSIFWIFFWCLSIFFSRMILIRRYRLVSICFCISYWSLGFQQIQFVILILLDNNCVKHLFFHYFWGYC